MRDTRKPPACTAKLQRVIRAMFTKPFSRGLRKARRYLLSLFFFQDRFDAHLAVLRHLDEGGSRPFPGQPLGGELTGRIIRDGLNIPELTAEHLHRLLVDRHALEELYRGLWASPESFVARRLGREAARSGEAVKACRAAVKEAAARAAEPPSGFDPHAECEEARVELGATSIIVYIDDPVWRGDFRIVCMPGVQFPEVMHGSIGHPAESSKSLITGGAAEEYADDVKDDEGLSAEVADTIDKHPAPIRRLFANFVRREGVRSRARLAHRVNGQTQLALFVNFSQPVDFDLKKDRIRRLFRWLVEHLAEMTQRLCGVGPGLAQQIVRVWVPARQLAEVGPTEEGGRSLREMLNSILDAALEAFGIGDTGFGTIHLYDRETWTLRLAAFRGPIDRPDDASAQSVHEPNKPGIVTLVALKRKAILIEDLDRSPYRAIHRCIRDGTRSELGVPMLAHGAVVGVVNLESTRPGVFTGDSIRVLSEAANEAAVAVALYREKKAYRDMVQFQGRLLEFAHRLALAAPGGRSALDELACIACETLGASMCDLWHYNPDTGAFDTAGFSDRHESHTRGPRPNGWSDYLLQTGWSVWITDVSAEDCFTALYWDPARQVWQACPPDAPPSRVSPDLLRLGIRCELGVPILLGQKYLGVAWFKYRDIVQRPSPHDVLRLTGFAGAVALVLYRNGKGPLLVPSEKTMSLAGECSGKLAELMLRILS